MSSSIWTACAAACEPRSLSADAWRVVEAQHQVSTRKLVASDSEQQLLEELIDGVKPSATFPRHLHYLLFTPFRYPPLRNGSRFGTRYERGIWYGSVRQSTAFSEVAYYRMLFLDGSEADFGKVEAELTAFRVLLRSSSGVDVTQPPFDRYESELASPVSYAASQPLGSALRAAGIALIRFRSARDVAGGLNVAAFTPDVFGRRQPRSLETWHSTASRDVVEVTRRDYFRRASFHFEREQFLVDGSLPRPALS
jgi:hypothetical protein